MSECSLSASSVSAEDHTRTEVALSSCPASPSGAVFYVYIHVLTFSLHRLYYKKLDGIFNRQSRPSNDPGSSWRTTLRAVTASCVYCATAAAFGILFGVYTIQFSTHPLPCILGYMSIALNVFALLNISVISVFARLARLDRGTNRELTGDTSAVNSTLVHAAALFAVPLSSLLWSMILTIVCMLAYATQPGVPDVQNLLPQSHRHTIARSTESLNRPWPRSVLMASYLAVAIFATLTLLQFIFVLRTAIRLVDLEVWGVTRYLRDDIEMTSTQHESNEDTASIASNSSSLVQDSLSETLTITSQVQVDLHVSEAHE